MGQRLNMMESELGVKIGKRIYNVSQAVEQSRLPKTIQLLAALRASQINGCGWCVDIHTKDAAVAGETAVRINLVAAWRHASVFTESERAALALTEEGTRLEPNQGISDATWALARKHYDDDQLIALVTLISMINATNRLSVILDMQGGSYEPGMFSSMAS